MGSAVSHRELSFMLCDDSEGWDGVVVAEERLKREWMCLCAV